MGKGWDHGVPGPEYWQAVLNACKPGAHLLAFGGTRTFHRLACAIEDAGWEMRDTLMWVYGSGFPKSHNLQGEYNGLGTALKPAWEPILLARKPLIGTVAANVQAHGTGALNIDACRIPTDPSTTLGRWPANLLHDGSPEVLACFPAQAGAAAPVKGTEPSDQHKSCYHDRARVPGTFFNDSGSAARFFYCAKASKQDRDEGLDEEMWRGDSKQQNSKMRYENGLPTNERPAKTVGKNTHPTVKPTPLMRYLCRLVTPPGGTVLDPFMGSGSTGKAATLEGLHFLGFDSDKSYLPISMARISHAIDSYKASAIQQSLSHLL